MSRLQYACDITHSHTCVPISCDAVVSKLGTALRSQPAVSNVAIVLGQGFTATNSSDYHDDDDDNRFYGVHHVALR